MVLLMRLGSGNQAELMQWSGIGRMEQDGARWSGLERMEQTRRDGVG